MSAIGSRDLGAYTRNLTGGIETSVPPTRIDPSQTPDARNIRFSNGAATARGGFTPHVRQQPMGNAVRNRGYHGRGHDASADGDSVVVPGYLVAGDRAIYDGLGSSLTTLCVSFFLRIDDLSTQTLGSSGTYPGVGRPITIKVRPIISKGPVKKTAQNGVSQDQDDFGVETDARGQACWNLTNAYGPSGDALEMTNIIAGGGFTTITTRSAHGLTTGDLVRLIGTGDTAFGAATGIDGVRVVTVTGANTFTVPVVGAGAMEKGSVLTKPTTVGHGLPFCVYLWNNSGTWQMRASCHVISGANFQLKTVTSSVPMVVGARYRIIASFTYTGALRLRVGLWNSDLRDFEYTCNELTWAGTTGCLNTPAPIQVFDCPQDFIERHSTDQPTWDTVNFWSRPPGLDLDSVTGGGYFFAAKRFEGSIDDIEIRKVGLASTVDTSFDRSGKLDLATTTLTTLVNYWSMLREGERLVMEETGRGNHLYFTPDFPLLDNVSGGLRSDRQASLWFNGTTSYAMMQRGGSNVRYRDNISSPADYAALEQIAKSRYPFGLQVEFWLDSLAEPFEQVLVEFHTVMRCVVRPDGRLAVYYRDDHTNVGAVGRCKYVGAIVGKTALRTGYRYSATFFWTGAALQVFIGEVLDISVAVALVSQTGWPVSGFTVGMGARRFTSWTGDTVAPIRADVDTADVDEINTDSRSGFCGRIERVKLLVRDATPSLQGVRDESIDDWRKAFTRIWRSPTAGANRDRLNPLFPDAAAASFTGAGAVAVIQGDTSDGLSIGYVLETTTGTDLVPLVERLPFGGHNVLEAVRVDFFSVVAVYNFDQSFGDDGVRCGRYMQSLEWRALGYAAGLILADEYRYVAEQESDVIDEVGMFPAFAMRCVQSDTLFEADGAFDIGVNPVHSTDQIVVQPWLWQSPREVGPRWDVGLAPPPAGKSPISLIADWDHQESGERFCVVGSHRSLYWARLPWRRDSPFVPRESVERSEDGSVWLYGQIGEHIACAQTDPRQILDGNIVSIDLWCKPQRLDGVRVIAAMKANATGHVNFAVLLWNGALVLCGTMDGNTKAWLLHEGDTPTIATAGTTSGRLPRRLVSTNAWNHIHVILGEWTGAPTSNSPQAWINGARVTLTSYNAAVNGGPTADSPSAGTPDTAGVSLYLGGLPEGFDSISLGMSTGGPLVLTTTAWHGMLTEFVQTDDENPSFPAAAGSPGTVPLSRHAVAAEQTYFLRLDATRSWVFRSLAPGLDAGSGRSNIAELVLIESNLEESSFARYSAAPFRDAMFLSNGKSRAQEIRFERSWHSRPGGPFDAHPIGMRQPTVHPDLTEVQAVYDSNVVDGALSRNYFPTGVYVLAMAFRDRHGRESEPEAIATVEINPTSQSISAWGVGTPTTVTFGSAHGFQNGDKVTIVITGSGNAAIDGIPMVYSVTSPTAGTIPVTTAAPPALGTAKFFPDGLRVRNLPRSVDPQTVARVFYCSPFGGGIPVKHSDELTDNESPTAELYAPADTSESIQVGTRLVPPRGRLIAVGDGRVFMAHLTDVAARGSSIAWSDQVEVTYFPFANIASVDSKDGRKIVGLASLLGRFYIGKRDSTFVFTGTALLPVNESVGCGGGWTLYDNVLYGGGERGVHRFDGANTVFASNSLRGIWPTLPLTDEDLLNSFGAYVRQNSEFWYSMRRTGEAHNSLVWVLSMAVGDAQVWAALATPAHSFMASVVDALTQAPKVLIGTDSGQLLEYDEDLHIDGSIDEPMPGEASLVLDGAATLAGQVLTIAAGKFDTIRQGMRGMPIVVTDGTTTFATRVLRNAATTAVLKETPPFAGAVTFEVGGYECAWSSGWIHAQRDGQWQIATEIDLEFRADATNLIVENAATISTRAEDGGVGTTYKPDRVFPTAGVEGRVQSLAEGFQSEPLAVKESNRGRYLRLRVRTSPLAGGIRSPWELWGIGFRWRAEGARGGRPS